ncbi:MAG: outer membrane protein assembly factor BamD [Planctomycetes bacterium]|nr:outer membrane protein assembly factor BamD [Planctomycetota bacterium]
MKTAVHTGRQTTVTLRSLLLPIVTACAVLATAPAYSQSTDRTLTGSGEWEVVSVDPPLGSPESDLAEAREALADRHYGRARKLADSWIKRYPSHGLVPEAYLIRADAIYLNGDPYKALFDYEVIEKQYPGTEAFQIAAEREYEIATAFANGKRRKFWGMALFDAYAEAEELLILVQERLPGSKLAQNAGRTLGDFYYRRREMDLAVIAYDLYLENHPRADDRSEVMRLLISAHLASAKGPAFDPSGLYEAKLRLDRLEREFPADAQQLGADGLRTRIDESDAQRMMADAKWYLNRKDPVSSRFVIKRLLRRYPESAAAHEGYEMMVRYGWIKEAPEAPDQREDQATNTADDPQAEPPVQADSETSDNQ